jgi:hypothetical protein
MPAHYLRHQGRPSRIEVRPDLHFSGRAGRRAGYNGEAVHASPRHRHHLRPA